MAESQEKRVEPQEVKEKEIVEGNRKIKISFYTKTSFYTNEFNDSLLSVVVSLLQRSEVMISRVCLVDCHLLGR